MLTHELGSVRKAVKDLMADKLQSAYPVNLSEMNAVISTLVEYKRVWIMATSPAMMAMLSRMIFSVNRTMLSKKFKLN